MKNLIFCFFFIALSGCYSSSDDSSLDSYIFKNPFEFEYYDFESYNFKKIDSKIISYYEQTPSSFSGVYHLIDVNLLSFKENFDIVLDFDNLTYTIYNKNYPKPEINYDPDSVVDPSFEEKQVAHNQSTSNGSIKIIGSVIYFDFTDNQHLKNPYQKENFQPALVIDDEEFFQIDIGNNNQDYIKIHFFNHYFQNKIRTNNFYIYFTFKKA